MSGYSKECGGYDNWDTQGVALIIMNNSEYYHHLLGYDDESEWEDEHLERLLGDVLCSISLDDSYENIDIYNVNREQLEDLVREVD